MSFRIIPSIYLKDGKVVNKNTMEIVGDGDAVALATLYNNRGADELIIFDISETVLNMITILEQWFLLLMRWIFRY